MSDKSTAMHCRIYLDSTGGLRTRLNDPPSSFDHEHPLSQNVRFCDDFMTAKEEIKISLRTCPVSNGLSAQPELSRYPFKLLHYTNIALGKVAAKHALNYSTFFSFDHGRDAIVRAWFKSSDPHECRYRETACFETFVNFTPGVQFVPVYEPSSFPRALDKPSKWSENKTDMQGLIEAALRSFDNDLKAVDPQKLLLCTEAVTEAFADAQWCEVTSMLSEREVTWHGEQRKVPTVLTTFTTMTRDARPHLAN